MVNIELTSQQAEELKKFYLSELEKVQKQEQVIKELIGKLGVNTPIVEVAPKAAVTVEAPKKAVAEEKVRKTRSNAKAEKIEVAEVAEVDEVDETKGFGWRKFIIDKLQEYQKPLSSKDFIKMYEKQFKVNISDSKKAKFSMNQALFLLRSKSNQIVSIKTDGKKEKLYALTEWEEQVITKKTRKPRTTKPKNEVVEAKSIELITEPVNVVEETSQPAL
jgi:hypothetical protein